MKRGGIIRLLVWPALAAGALWAALVCLKSRGLLPGWATWTHVNLAPAAAWPVLVAIAAAFGLGGFRYSLRTLAAFLLFATCAEALVAHWEPWYKGADIYPGGYQGIGGAVWSPDGEHIATGGSAAYPSLWDAKTGAQLSSIIIGYSMCPPAFAGIGSEILFVDGSSNSQDDYYDVRSSEGGQVRCSFRVPEGTYFVVRFSPDCRHLCVWADRGCRLLSLETGKEEMVLTSEDAPESPERLAFSGDSHYVVVGDWQDVHVWDIARRCRIRTFKSCDWQYGLSLSRDGRTLVLDDSIMVRVLDPLTGVLFARFEWPLHWRNESIGGIALAPGGAILAAVLGDYSVRMLRTDNGAEVWATLDDDLDARQARFSPDGKALLVHGYGWHVAVYRRRRPEWWWGVFYLKEFWATAVFAGFFAWSLLRDRKHFRALDERLASSQTPAARPRGASE